MSSASVHTARTGSEEMAMAEGEERKKKNDVLNKGTFS
jgi:hypothetical protein